MLSEQFLVLKTIEKTKHTLSKYENILFTSEWLADFEKQAISFKVTVPFIGGFSAGKSSLLNALIGSPLFSVNIDPETRFAAEVCFDQSEEISAHLKDGSILQLTQATLSDATSLPDILYFNIRLSHPVLEKIPHIKLVDMPGWESGIAAHSQVIDDYAPLSIAYCAVISVEEGCLRTSLCRALKEIIFYNIPIIVVLSKSDKRTEAELNDIAAAIEQEIIENLGYRPVAIIKTSARRKHVNELMEALESLEAQSGVLFGNSVTKNFLKKLYTLKDHLSYLTQMTDIESVDIQLQINQVEQEFEELESNLAKKRQQLELTSQSTIHHILEKTRDKIVQNIEFFCEKILQGGDLKDEVGHILRVTLQESMSDSTNLKIVDLLYEIQNIQLNEIRPTIEKLTPENNEESSILPILSVILPISKVIPKANIITPILIGAITLIEDIFSDSKNQEVEKYKQKEVLRNRLVNQTIPELTYQLEIKLKKFFNEFIFSETERAKREIQSQKAYYLSSLDQLKAKKAEGELVFHQKMMAYQADLDVISNAIEELEKND